MSEKQDWKQVIGIRNLNYSVPEHANTFWYSVGGLSLFCFVITIITGILLSQFYNPTPQVAHGSVGYISQDPGLGFIRALHHWSANVGFFLIIVHLIRVIFSGAYQWPRTITYMLGLGLMMVVFQMYFTGTVLKWDQEGYEAMAHFIAVNQLLGPLGAIFQEDFTFSTTMLARIYALHVSLFPLLFLILLGLHAFYVKHLGIAPKPYQTEAAYAASLAKDKTFTGHLKHLLIYGTLLGIILIILAYVWPPGLLAPPKPGVEMTKPPWLFWIFYPLESAVGIVGILLGSILMGTGLALIPVLGFVIHDERKRFKVVNSIVIVGLVFWVAMMLITYFSPTMQHL